MIVYGFLENAYLKLGLTNLYTTHELNTKLIG
jgi:hypothetical protein